ncbi:NTF2 and RRM domain-containing protein [Colletotrichum truncatum]|uniref:NTF2 and RRM domain-containing protein n=1 Tax=Colletotrichum truncatum TaxID=5467 RepID=A0ACC3YG74_COLTU|nr:NTF2 and RRM domain-containing protein [Colletotrichum truncatum]KAF6785503.1 NTF2 and RRM domain-containing protein [Colletotrichum truncatum]
MATNGNYTHPDQYKDAVEQSFSGPTATNDAAASAGNNSNLSKDEVGWYFVEQYYTTLSKNPDKLHLFYGKRSQFVYGMEAEVANVSVGRQAIQERIKSLDFQNSKVRITNVDSQASFDNIVIQVIGESSIKSAEPKKFVQTFVLAPQPSGYFVVNDILRYINDEDEEEAVAEAEAQPEEQAAPEEVVEAAAAEPESKAEKTTEEASAPVIDPEVVDKKLEEVSAPQDAASSNGDAEVAAPEPVKAAEPKVEAPTVDPEATAKEIAEEDIKEPEKPADPSPTPVVPAKAAAAEPEKPTPAPAPVPMKPMSWASRAAAAVGAKAAVPLPKTATPPAAASAKAPAPAAAAATPTPTAAPAAKEAEAPAAKEGSPSAEWQSVGADSKRQNRPQSISQAPVENLGTLGYVKYVTDKVKAEDLKAALAGHGELTYFDINRQKNCAFVEFATPAGYQAAVAANPHIVNGENIVVEPRRPKATAYGGSNYSAGGGRGNPAGGRGRGGFEGNRSGSQGNARGNFSGGQARGRGSVRGRGASQATA